MTPRELREKVAAAINAKIVKVQTSPNPKKFLAPLEKDVKLFVVVHTTLEIKVYYGKEYDYYKHGNHYSVVHVEKITLWNRTHGVEHYNPHIQSICIAVTCAFPNLLEKKRKDLEEQRERLQNTQEAVATLEGIVAQLESMQDEIKDW